MTSETNIRFWLDQLKIGKILYYVCFILFKNNYFKDLCVCVCVYEWVQALMCHITCSRSEENSGVSSTPGTKKLSSDLQASACVHWALLVALIPSFMKSWEIYNTRPKNSQLSYIVSCVLPCNNLNLEQTLELVHLSHVLGTSRFLKVEGEGCRYFGLLPQLVIWVLVLN